MKRVRTAGTAVIVLCAAGLLTAGCGASSSAPPKTTPTPTSSASAQPSKTQVVTYAPWASAGDLASGFSASSTQSGSCSSASDTGTPDAFNCSVGNQAYDPCFPDASSGAGEVMCPNRQNPDSGTVINLSSALPAPNTASASLQPWLVVLANGQTCAWNSGMVATLGGLPETFLCANGAGTYGDADQSNATWTISYAPSGATASAMTKVDITTAYE